jgi:hypothetical protein
VGEIISELCRWPDRAAVNFRCGLLDQEFRFYRLQERSKDVIEIEINPYPESPPVVSSAAPIPTLESPLSAGRTIDAFVLTFGRSIRHGGIAGSF